MQKLWLSHRARTVRQFAILNSLFFFNFEGYYSSSNNFCFLPIIICRASAPLCTKTRLTLVAVIVELVMFSSGFCCIVLFIVGELLFESDSSKYLLWFVYVSLSIKRNANMELVDGMWPVETGSIQPRISPAWTWQSSQWFPAKGFFWWKIKNVKTILSLKLM